MADKTLTQENLLAARTYMPVGVKQSFLRETVANCFARLEVAATGGWEDGGIPPMYCENTVKKSRYLMGALVGFYLGMEFHAENGDENLMDEQEYDDWARAHVLNQIDRMKKVTAVRDICFDLLQDYRDLEKRMNAELYGMMNAMNDPCMRLVLMTNTQTSPEYLQNAVKQLAEIRDNMDGFTKESQKG